MKKLLYIVLFLPLLASAQFNGNFNTWRLITKDTTNISISNGITGWYSGINDRFRVNINGTSATVYTTLNPPAGFSDPMTTRGDILIRDASNVTARLPVGANTYVLTSDGTDVAWAAPGGGSGILSTSVTVSSAQLLDLNSTPIELIAAPGAGQWIDVISVVLFMDYNSIAYATNVDVALRYGSTQEYVNSNILSQTADAIVTLDRIQSYHSANQALNIISPAGNPTAGNGELKIHVVYKIITL